MNTEEKKAFAEWLKGQSLLESYKQYSNPNNHNLRIILEVIHYLLGITNLYDYFKKEDDILAELKDRFAGLMTIGATVDLQVETEKYFDENKKLFEDVEIIV